MQILDIYFKYTGRLLLGRALFFALGRALFVVILAELHEKPRRKYWVAEKTLEEKKLLREGYHFFDSTSSFLCLFVTFFVYTLSLFKWRIWVYGWYSVRWYHKWKVENMKISYNSILHAFFISNAKVQSHGVATLLLNFLPISAWHYLKNCCLQRKVSSGWQKRDIKSDFVLVLVVPADCSGQTLNCYLFWQKLVLKTKIFQTRCR